MRNQEKKETPSIDSVSLKVYYAKSKSLTSQNRSFKEVMLLIWKSDEFKEYDPLKIVFISTGKTLYADKAYFHSFIDGNISMWELIELTQCDELYRNTVDFKADESNIVVEKDSLWKLKNNKLTLIDDDNHVETVLSSFFEIAE
jgi:hypothetical protein